MVSIYWSNIIVIGRENLTMILTFGPLFTPIELLLPHIMIFFFIQQLSKTIFAGKFLVNSILPAL